MDKFNTIKKDLSKFYNKDITLNLSPASGYRSRCEFGFKNNQYTMMKAGKKIFFDSFNLPVSSIQDVMKPLLELICDNPQVKDKLFQVNFRSVEKIVLVTLIYHKVLSDNWLKEANKIGSQLNISIIGRSRNQMVNTDLIELEEHVKIEPSFYLYQDDKTFYQPNAYLMPKMIECVQKLIKEPRDLLELYCGSGTFTIPLSFMFNDIFATENNRSSIRYLKKSIKKSNITNIHHARLSDNELTEAFNGKNFRRMADIDINVFNFSHVLVDPPRSGLNNNVTQILSKFNNIIYISCNPSTFERDLVSLKGYKIKKVEVFDQFSNTSHLELIALLVKN